MYSSNEIKENREVGIQEKENKNPSQNSQDEARKHKQSRLETEDWGFWKKRLQEKGKFDTTVDMMNICVSKLCE